LRHVAACSADAALRETAGYAHVRLVGSAGDTRGVIARTTDRRDHEVTLADAFDSLSHLHDLTDGFMPQHEVVKPGRRGSEFETDDISIGPADSHLQRVKEDLLG